MWPNPQKTADWVTFTAVKIPGSSNLNLSFSGAQQTFWVRGMKEKCVIFCFPKLKSNVSAKSSGEGWLFCGEVNSLLSKLIFTHFDSCWSRNHEIVGKFTG